MKRLLLLPVFTMLMVSLVAVAAGRRHPRMFNSIGTHMMVFAGDSLNVNDMTFIVDGDTVSRDHTLSIPPSEIYSLTVTKSPANCLELVTRSAMQSPLPPSQIPTSVVYMIDSVEVDAETFTNFPADSVRALTVSKGENPMLNITTIQI